MSEEDAAGGTGGRPDRPAARHGTVLVRSEVGRHLQSASTELSEAVAGAGRAGARAWRGEAIRLLGACVSAARHGLLPLDDETTGRILLALQDVVVRDAACGLVSTGPEDPVERLFVGLTVRAPAWYGAAPAGVLAFLRWRRGDRGGALRAAELALNHDAGPGLASLVREAALSGLDPDRWPRSQAPAERQPTVRKPPRRGGRRTRSAR